MEVIKKAIQIKLEFQSNRNHWLSFGIDLQKINEIVALAGNLSTLTKGKIISRYSKQIQALFTRAQNISSKFHNLIEQYKEDIKDLDRIISYYVRDKDAAIKETIEVQLHSYSPSSNGDISATSIKLARALNDFTGAVAELWEVLRFYFASRLKVEAQNNWKKFITKNKGIIVDYKEFSKLPIFWNMLKHSNDLAISNLSYKDNYFTEPEIIQDKNFSGLSVSGFVDKLLDDTIFILKEAEKL